MHMQLCCSRYEKRGASTASDKSWAWRPGNEARHPGVTVELFLSGFINSIHFLLDEAVVTPCVQTYSTHKACQQGTNTSQGFNRSQTVPAQIT